MSYQNGPTPPTPSSEIIHCITTFIDTLDSVPPTLTRSLSDLKELDAVLSGSFANITAKLELLSSMMKAGKEVTPFERLKLLREVTEDARVFRLGGEDKIRVATTTCESMATSTAHLSTLSSLLLKYLPAHLLPLLPPPSAPNGYPASITPSSKIARRQIFDYPIHNHPGQGSTSRMQSAVGMVNEHWDITRGRSTGKRDRKPMGTSNQSMGMGDLPYSMHSHPVQYKERDKELRHPNQYTKKKIVIPNEIPNQSMNYPVPNNMIIPPHSQQPIYNQGPGQQLQNPNSNQQQHQHHNHQSLDQVNNPNGRTTGITFPNLNPPAIPEYSPQSSLPHSALPPPTQKRKSNESPPPPSTLIKRRKKSTSPIPSASAVPNLELPKPELVPTENFEFVGEVEEGLELEEGEDGDGQIYCYCHRISFGEMIGCDGTECEREWFHLACVGLSSIPKGRWFCEECRRKAADKGKKRR